MWAQAPQRDPRRVADGRPGRARLRRHRRRRSQHRATSPALPAWPSGGNTWGALAQPAAWYRCWSCRGGSATTSIATANSLAAGLLLGALAFVQWTVAGGALWRRLVVAVRQRNAKPRGRRRLSAGRLAWLDRPHAGERTGRPSPPPTPLPAGRRVSHGAPLAGMWHQPADGSTRCHRGDRAGDGGVA